MWSAEEERRQRKVALASGGSVTPVSRGRERLSRSMAMFLGAIAALEVMIAGAMVLNIDFFSADVIALVLAFVVLYFGIVALLTDK